jgi:hypothetical protein
LRWRRRAYWDEVRQYARERLVGTPSLDAVARPARQVLLELVSARLAEQAAITGRV